MELVQRKMLNPIDRTPTPEIAMTRKKWKLRKVMKIMNVEARLLSPR